MHWTRNSRNQTDDFAGPIAHSVNLALKGIEAVGAMGQIAAIAGNAQDAHDFKKQSQSMIATWAQLSQNTDGNHLLLQYREPANAYSPDTTRWGKWPDGSIIHNPRPTMCSK